MPTYEYECERCGEFEVPQGMNEKKLPRCPHCRAKVKRLISGGSGFILKGAGFYQNDYKRSHIIANRPKKKSAQEGMGQWSEEAQEQYGEVDKGNRETFKKEKMVDNKGNIKLDGKY